MAHSQIGYMSLLVSDILFHLLSLPFLLKLAP